MSQIADTLNDWAEEVNNFSDAVALQAFEVRVMAYANAAKESIQDKINEYTILNATEPTDPGSTMAWAALQYAQAIQTITAATAEVGNLTNAIANLTAAIAAKAAVLGA